MIYFLITWTFTYPLSSKFTIKYQVLRSFSFYLFILINDTPYIKYIEKLFLILADTWSARNWYAFQCFYFLFILFYPHHTSRWEAMLDKQQYKKN